MDRKLRLEDFDSLVLEGTTNATGDTSSKFKHGRGAVPTMVMVLEGNVYLPKNGRGPNEVDVRSPNSSEAFTLLLLF